ncbi:MAG: S8 family serine peptidase [Myxococcaceae bacterium]
MIHSQMLSLVFTINALSATFLHSHEIAVVSGVPDESIGFVRRMVREKVNFVSGESEQYNSTAVYSILNDSKIEDAAVISVLSKDGTVTKDLFLKGLESAVSKAPVVYTNIALLNEAVCDFMGKHAETQFVFAAGDNGIKYSEEIMWSCSYANILIVTALDQSGEDLLPFSNWGSRVWVAAPGYQIAVVIPGGNYSTMTGSAVASAVVAAKFAVYLNQNPTQDVISSKTQFLSEHEVFLPKLVGKVTIGFDLNSTPTYEIER